MDHLKEITLRLEKLSKNWESFLKLLQRRHDKEAVADFADVRARQLLDEFWEILQLIFDDVAAEMEKQGYDPEIMHSIPQQVWDIIKPKLIPVLNLHQQDLSAFYKNYTTSLALLSDEIKDELIFLKDMKPENFLKLLNDIMKGN